MDNENKIDTSVKTEKKIKKSKSKKESLVVHNIPDTTDEMLKFKRLEIICSQAMVEELLDGFQRKKIKFYTELPSVMGSGYSVPKLGNSIWPQLNAMFIVYCNKENALKIKEVIKTLRKQFVGEGIACFVSKAKEW